MVTLNHRTEDFKKILVSTCILVRDPLFLPDVCLHACTHRKEQTTDPVCSPGWVEQIAGQPVPPLWTPALLYQPGTCIEGKYKSCFTFNNQALGLQTKWSSFFGSRPFPMQLHHGANHTCFGSTISHHCTIFTNSSTFKVKITILNHLVE